MASAQNDKLVIFRGDDTGGAFGRTLAFTIEAAEGVSLEGCRAEWIFDGIVKTMDAPLVPGEVREIFYSHNETCRMALGVRYGTFRIIDSAGKRATMTNTKAVEVTDNVARCYPGSSSATVHIGTTIAWEQIAGKPLLVKTINGEAPDASGNINILTGGYVKHADFADIEVKEGMTLKEVGSMVNTLALKLKGGISPSVLMLSACCLSAFGAFADATITPDTDFGDISPTAKLGAVVIGGGAVTDETDPTVADWAKKPNPAPVTDLMPATNYANAVAFASTNYTDAAVASATNGIRKVDGAARPLPKYLHVLSFDDVYTNEAAAYYRSRGNGKVDGGCSAVRDSGFLYRNFDFPFDDRAEFVVKMSAANGRFASVGVAQVGTNLTEDVVTSGKWSPCYKWLPGATVDGINEKGVVAEINVVDTPVTGWYTTGDLHPLAAVRWVLDNATNAQSAAEYIAANIHFPSGWEQNFHYLVADETATYIVENGTASNITGKVVMTNFPRLPPISSGMGIERYLLLAGGANITNVWYTNAYRRDTDWISEFKDAAEMEAAKSAWETHTREQLRGHGLWQTVHTSVYDISNLVLRVAVQEVNDWYTFQVPSARGVKPEDVREIVQPMIQEETDALWEYDYDQDSRINSAHALIQDRVKKITEINGHNFYNGDIVLTPSDLGAVPTNRTINGQALTHDLIIEGMTDNALVLTNGEVKTKGGGVVIADYIEFEHGESVGAALLDIGDIAREANGKADAAQAHSEATRAIVYTWEGFLDGSNVVFSITNYISGAYSLDHSKLEIKELRDGVYHTVYESRTEITNHTEAAKREIYGVVNSTAAVLRAEIAAKGDKAWGRRSSTGQEVPISNTVWVTEQNLRIAGGMEYERVAVGEGAVYVLASKGQTPYLQGDEGALMLKDDGGTNYFGMVRSDSYTIGCNTDGIRTDPANHLVYLDYQVTMSDHPVVWYMASLENYDEAGWEQLNYPDGSPVPGASHQVYWDDSPRLGAQECYINVGDEPSGFFRSTIEVPGDCRFKTNMPAEIPSFWCTDDPTKKVKVIWNGGNPKFVEAQ